MLKSTLLAAAVLATAGSLALADPVRLEFWSVDQDGQYAYSMAKAYEAEHPDVTVNVRRVQFPDIVNDLARAASTGNAPDLSYVDNPDVALLATRGVLGDLTAAIAADKTIDMAKFYPGPRSAATVDGKVYALPRGANTLALYYNADMFRAHGLDPDRPPRTWDELYAAAKALADPAKNVYGLAFSAINSEEGTFQFLPWVQMAGGSYDHVNGPGAVEALQFWQKLIDEKLASPDTLVRGQYESTGTFNAGNAAMAISGPWELPRMSREAKFDWRVALLPTKTAGGPHASALGEGTNVIPARAKHPKEAFAMLSFMNARMPSVWNDFGFLPAARVEVPDPKWPAAFKVFSTALEDAKVRGPSADWVKISKPIQTAVQAALTHQTDAKTALDTAQSQIDRVLKR